MYQDKSFFVYLTMKCEFFTADKALMINTSGLFMILNNQFSSVGAKY